METASTSSSDRRLPTLPGGRGVRTAIGIAVVLLLAGLFAFDGVMAGVVGLWGLSLLVATVVGYVGYRVWYHYGS